MKTPTVFAFVIVPLIVGASPAFPGQDEDLIQKTLVEAARTLTDFPRTRDVQAVLKFYAKDYASINRGKTETLVEMEKALKEIDEQIELGSPVGISHRVSNIKAQVSGPIGWATYDYVAKLGMAGQVVNEEQGMCTAILRKKGAEWLTQHEHCSGIDDHPMRVELASLTSPVRPGENATITILTTPGAECKLTIQYSSVSKELEPQTADGDGTVTWTWTVGPFTTPGTWPIVATCSEHRGTLEASLVVR